MYPLNMGDKQILGAVKKWSIKTFEREAAKLGLDVEYHYFDYAK